MQKKGSRYKILAKLWVMYWFCISKFENVRYWSHKEVFILQQTSQTYFWHCKGCWMPNSIWNKFLAKLGREAHCCLAILPRLLHRPGSIALVAFSPQLEIFSWLCIAVGLRKRKDLAWSSYRDIKNKLLICESWEKILKVTLWNFRTFKSLHINSNKFGETSHDDIPAIIFSQ